MTLLSWAFFNGAEVVTAGGISRFEEDWAFEREALLTELNRPIWEPVKPPAAAAHMNGMSTLAPVVTAQRCGEEKRFLVPKDDYDTRSDSKELGAQRTFIVDPSRHQELPQEPEKPKTIAPRFHGVETSKLTDLQRSRAENELYKRWQSADGRVRTMREIIEAEGITGKTAWTSNGKTEYHLSSRDHVEDRSGYSFPVSKALWDAVDAPDSRSEADRASRKANLAWGRRQNATGWDEARKAKAIYEKLSKEADRIRTEERLAKGAAKSAPSWKRSGNSPAAPAAPSPISSPLADPNYYTNSLTNGSIFPQRGWSERDPLIELDAQGTVVLSSWPGSSPDGGRARLAHLRADDVGAGR